MADSRNANISYEGDGTQTVYSFPFDYLRKAFVKVQLIDGDTRQDLTQGVDYTVNDREVTLTSPTTKIINIYRDTSLDPLVTWSDASVLRANDMTLQEIQLLHIVAEAKDMLQDNGMTQDENGDWNGRYHKITNILSPELPNDVVTKAYFDDAKTGVKEDRVNAEIAATNAKASETKANASEVNAKASEAKASASEVNAKNSETNASESETNAKDSENRAASSASSAAGSASAAALSASTAKEAETNANNSEVFAKKWAESDESPDEQADEDSPTGKTMSAKSWSEEAKKTAENLKNPVADIEKQGDNLRVTFVDGTPKDVPISTLTIQQVMDVMFPVGIVVPVANGNDPPFISYGTWEKVGSGRVLWGAEEGHPAGTTIEPGLPNIKGNNEAFYTANDLTMPSGAFIANKKISASKVGYYYGGKKTASTSDYHSMFDASKSNSIYGKSTTVQPPAYVVTLWKRTA